MGRATEGQWNLNGWWGGNSHSHLNSTTSVTSFLFDNSSHPDRREAFFCRPTVPNFLFPIYLAIKKNAVEKEDNELLLQCQHHLLLTLCRHLQLGLQLLMMRDDSKKRRIPSVHWAGGHHNLITNGCLEYSIRFFLQTRCSLQAWDCPRSGQLHLFLCSWLSLCLNAAASKTVPQCFYCKT